MGQNLKVVWATRLEETSASSKTVWLNRSRTAWHTCSHF